MKEVLAVVEWLDACGPNDMEGFCEEDLEGLTPLLMRDVGFLIKKPTHVLLAGNKSDEGVYRRLICIPNGMVKKIRILR